MSEGPDAIEVVGCSIPVCDIDGKDGMGSRFGMDGKCGMDGKFGMDGRDDNGSEEGNDEVFMLL